MQLIHVNSYGSGTASYPIVSALLAHRVLWASDLVARYIREMRQYEPPQSQLGVWTGITSLEPQQN